MKKLHCSVQCHINSIVHKLHPIKFEEVEQVESLKINP